jgi:DNA mismatch repair ATPase MutS
VEALQSLAAYSYEHPDDQFPEFIATPVPPITPEPVSSRDSRVVNPSGLGARDLALPLADVGTPPVFEGDDLGHPLLPAAQCVRNSIALGSSVQVLLVSGSNMSGKSTFLRTVGINAVLAMAGAPVRARSLRLAPLCLGTAIRVTDSLQAGRSGFFAEITRLRQIMDLTVAGLPVLFLLDELLHGTNSHDRRIGAEALVRALIERGAIGVVTTHDLALTAIGTAGTDGRVRNAHFQDELRDGRMLFDYRLHDGVVTHSNALELMRSVGLDV